MCVGEGKWATHLTAGIFGITVGLCVADGAPILCAQVLGAEDTGHRVRTIGSRGTLSGNAVTPTPTAYQALVASRGLVKMSLGGGKHATT
ncbi:MAG: hypothetical protein ACJAV4_000340 [Pontimonas sp.]|jgi:hypothetical protein